MIYAQFYLEAKDGTLQEACGDRGVLILDGRIRKNRYAAIATEWAIDYGYRAYSIHEGASFLDSRRVSGPWAVYKGAPDNSAMSATYGA